MHTEMNLVAQPHNRQHGAQAAGQGASGRGRVSGPQRRPAVDGPLEPRSHRAVGVDVPGRLPDVHLKDLRVEDMDDQRRIRVGDRELVNFGSDSFLGLDRHPAVQQALIEATGRWGTHNGASRAFCSVSLCEEAEQRLARWLGVEDTLIFPSVTLANIGLLPAVTTKGDLLVVDRQSHDTIHQAAKIAAADGAILQEVPPLCAESLERMLEKSSAENRVVAVDGVYSMTGKIPPLRQIEEVTRRYGGILYVDDAHGTASSARRARRGLHEPGQLGPGADGRLAVQSVFLHGRLCHVQLAAEAAAQTAVEHVHLRRTGAAAVPGRDVRGVRHPGVARVRPAAGRLHSLMRRLIDGIRGLGLTVLGSESPIVSVVMGDIEQTLQAGKWLFDRGYYVQSATYPAVPLTPDCCGSW